MTATGDDWGHARELPRIAGQVAIVGVGESAHTKASGRSTEAIVGEAVEAALADAGLEPTDVDAICHGVMPGAFDPPAFHAHFGTSHDIVSSPAGGGMTYAATAPIAAAELLAGGAAQVVLNTFGVAWASQRSSMLAGPGQMHADEQFKQNLEIPFGWFPQPVYFATIARRHMHEFGTTEDHLGAVAVTCRRHAQRTPGAVMHDRPLTIDAYRSSPYLVEPFRREDCCLISDGGGAYVMTGAARARDLRQPVVEVAGVGWGASHTRTHWAQQGDFTATPQVFAAPAAFAMAGIDPGDVDVYACYDPFTIVTLMQIEDSGFCAKGDAGPFAAEGGLDFDGGRLPTNTHGGLLSHAYVLGIAHVVELVRQLRGEAGAQVDGAAIAAYGGYTGMDAATLVLRRA
jgi:acetyl-CoA acetyltransferase